MSENYKRSEAPAGAALKIVLYTSGGLDKIKQAH